jgi:hypothetical protein
MNQIIYFILLLSLIVYSSTAAGSTCSETEASKSNCKSYTNLNAAEKLSGDSCCYLKAKYQGETGDICIVIFKEKVKDVVKEYKDYGYKKVSIVCSSNWLRFGLSLMLLVLLL